MKFNNPKLEQAIRNLLAQPRYRWTNGENYNDRKHIELPGVDTTGRDLTTEDLLFVNGILISQQITNGYSVPWQGDSSAFQMQHPNLFITWDMVDWDDLFRFSHIKALRVYSKDRHVVPLECFPNLIDLSLECVAVTDWEHIEMMSDLHMLYVYDCGNEGNQLLVHVNTLQRAQRTKIKAIRDSGGDILAMKWLNHLCLIKMNISDVSPIMWRSPWCDVNLSFNEIEDISVMESSNVYYLTLRHNKIKDVSALRNNNCYLVNLRHNRITDITPLIKAKRGGCSMRRVYINYNPVPREQLEQLANKGFYVRDDFTDGDGVRQDFTYGSGH